MARMAWTDTKLWAVLQDRGEVSRSCTDYLPALLTDVETLLASASTSPLDFTLHDDQHSFRVAERIVDLLSRETLSALSEFEIALLLCGAYLHDIGMNPSRQVVKAVNAFLLDSSDMGLSERERNLLQNWLDSYEPGTQSPVLPDSTILKRIEKANELTTYFCRYRHNDWSGDYIKEHAVELGSVPYPTWVNDLTLLCKSHHYGIEKLITNEFDLRVVGPNNSIVNLRYLAALLRVADVMEIDPERTPPVLFQHRSIDRKSIVYWHKDQSMVLSLNANTNDILITARTNSAWEHKAVIETIDWIDSELRLYGDMDRSGLYLRGMHTGSLPYYNWNWPSRVIRDVLPAGDKFTYIEGAFRPNTQRILRLLAGTQLYRDPFASIRELVQNSADAVREQIAYELIDHPGSVTEKDLEARGRFHLIDIKLVREADDLYLVCLDTGTGMSKDMIETHLLVSGASPRPEVLSLRRLCAAKGIKFERSGEFGIGVLIYFMMADQISIDTKPGEEVSPSDRSAWQFNLDGLSGFGELRSVRKRSRGTQIRMKLKTEFSDADSENRLFSYIRRIFVKSPCRLSISTAHSEITCEPGWVRDQLKNIKTEYGESMVSYSGRNDNFMSKQRADLLAKQSSRSKKYHSDQQQSLSLYGPTHKDLEEYGSGRAYVPFYKLEEGASLYFVQISKNIAHEDKPGDFIAKPPQSRTLSWKGFLVEDSEVNNHRRRRGFGRLQRGAIETDLIGRAMIAVDRTSIEMSNFAEVSQFEKVVLQSLEQKFFAENESSPYSVFDRAWCNWRAAEKKLPLNRWLFKLESNQDLQSGQAEFRPIKFPAIVNISTQPNEDDNIPLEVRKRNGIVDQCVPFGTNPDQFRPLINIRPTRMLVREAPYIRIYLVYEGALEWDDAVLQSVPMPSAWSNVLCIDQGSRLFNADNIIFQSVSNSEHIEYLSLVKGLDLPEIMQISSSHKEVAASFMIYNIRRDQEFWQSVMDNFPEEWGRLWSKLDLGERPVICWNEQYSIVANCIWKEKVQRLRISIFPNSQWQFMSRPSREWFM